MTTSDGINGNKKMSDNPTQEELQLLNHIHSLHIVSERDIGHGPIGQLLKRGWIHQVWIGSYTLSETGKKIRRESPASKSG